MNRKISSLVFLVIVIMFVFPWVTVSCAGQPVTTATGFQVMKGDYTGYANIMSEFGSEAPKTQLNPWLILAFIAAIVGIVVGLLNGDAIIDKILVALSSIEAILLVIFPLQLLYSIRSELSSADEFEAGMNSMVKIGFRAAFFVALFLSIGCVVLNAYHLMSHKKVESLEGSQSVTSRGSGDLSSYIFCPQCGAKNPKANKFCNNCGAKLK